jgi:plastocyanin
MRHSLAARAATLTLAAALLTAAGGVAAQQLATAPATVEIDNFTFTPETLTVPAGTSVTWVNKDEEPHTVVNVGPTRLFKSAGLDTGDSFTMRFDKPGTYEYVCTIHPHMHGTIVVK